MKKKAADYQNESSEIPGQEIFEDMEEPELYCGFCGELKPKTELWLSWRNASFFQRYPRAVCKDEKNCHFISPQLKAI
jgi:hypothetical protein